MAMPWSARTAGLRLTRAAAALTLFLAAGCGDPQAPALKTYPAGGKVALPGGKPFPGGLVEFRSTTHPTATITGTITEADGRFSLSTLVLRANRNQTLPGAPPGTYRVTIILPPQQKQVGPRSIHLPKTYQIKPQDNNEFILTVEPQARRG
jgi:hypothetical protein